MSLPRLVASMSWMFPGRTARDGYPAARKLGFEVIEHSFPYDIPASDTIALLEENGLELCLLYTPCRYREGEKGFACVPGREVEFANSIDTAIDYALKVRCPVLGILAGEIPESGDRARYLDVLTLNLQAAADAARSAGLQITLEPICARRIPRFALHTLAEASSIVSALGRPNVSICFDTFHVAMEQGSLIEGFDAYKDQIGYLQISNPPGRNGPGEGELDLAFFVDHILRNGWNSWISCEYSPKKAAEADPFEGWAKRFIAESRIAARSSFGNP